MNDQQRNEQRERWKVELAELAKRNRRRQVAPRRTGIAAARVGMVRLAPRRDGRDGPGAA